MGERSIRIGASLPSAAALETGEPGQFQFSFANSERLIAAGVFTRPEALMRVFFLSTAAGAGLGAEGLGALLPDDWTRRPIPELPGPVDQAARDAGVTLSALFCELVPENCFPESPEEDLSAYCTMSVSSHGFPAGVLVRGDQFLLPGRSGLPLGVVGEPQYLLQNIDIEPGDDYYLHSDLTHVGELRRLHKGLTRHELDSDFLEGGLCLIRMSFT